MTARARLIGLLAVALLAASCSAGGAEPPPLVTTSSTSAAPTDTGSDAVAVAALIEQVECPGAIAGDDVSCGLARVPLDRLRPDGAITEISIATVRGQDSRFTTPLAVLQGGPGGASTDLAGWLSPRAFTQVFVDQRGTGFAAADFDCDEYDDALGDVLEALAPDAARLTNEAFDACAHRLADDELFAHTTTANHAADVASVMAGLGYDRWVAYGVSYGSTIAFELLRQPVDSLVGVVLDGVYPPDVDIDAGIAASADAALRELTTTCRADPLCADYSDDVTAALERSMERLDDSPVVVGLSGPASGVAGGVEVVIDGTRLAELVFLLLYDERTVRFLPAVIDGIDNGDAASFEWLASTGSRVMVSAYGANNEATFYAVQCHDRYPFSGPPPDGLTPFAATIARTSLEAACPVWGQRQAYDIAGTAVQSDLPTLLLSGQFDPITPEAYAMRAAETLDTVTLVTQAGRGHGIWIGDECIGSIVADFVADPARTLDTACADVGVAVEWAAP